MVSGLRYRQYFWSDGNDDARTRPHAVGPPRWHGQSAPRFKDPPHDFRSQKINQSQFVIVDVRFLKVRFIKVTV